MITIDFETEAIVGNPLVDPPKPIGVAVKIDDRPSKYHTGLDMEQVLALCWDSRHELLFHNAPFDLAVAEEWLGLSHPGWERVHDTQFLLYLIDPHADTLSLKPSAIKRLKMDGAERDELHEWILANVKGATKRTAGAYICKAPLELVSKYACMDVDMTFGLYRDIVTPEFERKGLRPAYDLERELQPYLAQAEKDGIRVDVELLERDLERAESSQKEYERRVCKELGRDFNVHNANELADALDSAGKIGKWVLTEKTGRRSTSRANLRAAINDPSIIQLLEYGSSMQTCLTTFMRPWIQLARTTGRLHPSWNQVRGDKYGTRTGRLSCSNPNLQNVPNPFSVAVDGLSPIPNMRDYLLPEDGCLWVSRDFSAQEMRLLAHFEQGALMDGFNRDPSLDPHTMVQELIQEQTGLLVPRKRVKNISFGIMYGMGPTGMSKQMGCSKEEAIDLINAYNKALPGVAGLKAQTAACAEWDERAKLVNELDKMIERTIPEKKAALIKLKEKNKRIVKETANHITTVGGRQYEVEKEVNGRSLEYKLLNYLIQGSAADQTKRSLLHWFRNCPAGHQFLATVHDEINISIPCRDSDEVLKQAMEQDAGLNLKVPMQTTLEVGRSWGQLEKETCLETCTETALASPL